MSMCMRVNKESLVDWLINFYIF